MDKIDDLILAEVLDATLDKYTEFGRKRRAHREAQARYRARKKQHVNSNPRKDNSGNPKWKTRSIKLQTH